MNNFTLSPTLNKNKVFILNKSELVDRWDPLLVLYKRENQSFKYETKKLKSLIVSNPEYGAGEIGIERKTETEPRYIRITDIDEFGLLSSDIGVTAKTIEKKYLLNDNDFLFARSGATVGKAYLHKKDLVPYPCFYAGYMIRYRLNEKEMLPEYLFAITQTRFYKNWVRAIQRPTGQPNINAEEYKSLTFPLPPFEIQKKVVKIFSLAYEQKKQNEAQAEKLLASIDDYLLSELGITLPTPPENILKNRIYQTSIKEIMGGRFDPKLYSPQTKALIKALFKTKYKFQTLKSLTVHTTAGDWGLDENEKVNENEYVKCLVLRATEFDNKFNLNVEGSRAKYRLINKIKLTTLDIQTDDLIIEKSGGSIDQPVGRIAILNKDLINNYTLCFSNFVHKIRVNQNIIYPEFAFNYLKTIHNIKITDVMQSQTNGIRNLILSEYFNLPIPVPTLAKQKEIAEHISAIRQQAQQLKEKTKEELKKASEEIEKILLTQ